MRKIVMLFLAIGVIFGFAGASYAGLNDGLVAYYPFSGNVNDESGNGHNGTLGGDPIFVTGAVGQAIELDGNNPGADYVDIGISSDYNLTKFSVCAWIYPFTGASGQILAKEGSFSVGLYYNIYVQGAIWIGGHWAQSHSSVSNPQPPIPANQWTYICVTYGDGYMRFYVNGKLVNSYKQSRDPDQTHNPVYIGFESDAAGTHAFEGRLDEVRLYNRALTETEVQTLYSGNAGDNCAQISSDLDIYIPCGNFGNYTGSNSLWVDLEYAGQDSQGNHYWKLVNFGQN